MEKEIAGASVDVSDEGYLTDATQWTKEIGAEIAKEEGVEMSDEHWAVVDFIRQSFQNEESLSIRSIGKRGPASIKEFYALFPGGPLKKASRIAGIPKPSSCM